MLSKRKCSISFGKFLFDDDKKYLYNMVKEYQVGWKMVEKIKAIIMGHAIGDALGVPVEFEDEIV